MTEDAESTARDQQALHERLLQVERSIPSSVTPMMAVVLVVAWTSRHHLPRAWLMVWLLSALLALGGRLLLARRTVAAPPPVDQVRMMLRRMVLSAVPGGVLLAVTAWMFFRPDDPVTLMALAVLPMLAFAGQVASAAPPLPVLATLLGPGILTLIVLGLVSGHELGRFIALLLLLFSAAMTRIARLVGSALEREIRARLDNQQLAAHLAAASQAKSRFLAAASHDIRQPVHALSLFLGAFDDGALSGRNAQLIGPLRESARGLREMLDGVLDLSRAEAGALLSRPVPLAAQALLDLVEREFAPLAEVRGLSLRTVPSRRWLLADPTLTERILRNLVSNALRYTARGGVLVGLRQRGGSVLLEVWDTGMGIAAAEQESLFAEFTRGSGAADAERAGLGLGLAIARRFALAQGAALGVASRVGRGSVFRLALPLAAEPPVAQPASAVAPTDLAGLRVLLVDDDAGVRSATALQLRDWGCEVDCRASPDELSGIAPVPQVAITDNQFEGRQRAHEVARALGADVPLLVVTGEAQAANLAALRAAGALVLAKPVEPAALRAALARLVQG